MSLDESWLLKSSSSAGNMIEILQNYVSQRFRTIKKYSHIFMKSEPNEKFEIGAVRLQRCRNIFMWYKNYTFEANLRLDL
eukprot:snap_masked-scaffold_22-processed-gene-3.18-mRNA-1 protein AED:1.00 eAED:1.00 QI:0/-1/0/0/-1/1/1/0/79